MTVTHKKAAQLLQHRILGEETITDIYYEGTGRDIWLDTYRDILLGYDSVVHLTDAEHRTIPYVILANQFVCVAWFSEQEKYQELFETSKEMTLWLLQQWDALCNL